MREECLRRGSRKGAEHQREAIPGRGANHRERTALLGGGASKRDREKTMFNRTEGARAPSTEGGATELSKVDRSEAQQAAPN